MAPIDLHNDDQQQQEGSSATSSKLSDDDSSINGNISNNNNVDLIVNEHNTSSSSSSSSSISLPNQLILIINEKSNGKLEDEDESSDNSNNNNVSNNKLNVEDYDYDVRSSSSFSTSSLSPISNKQATASTNTQPTDSSSSSSSSGNNSSSYDDSKCRDDDDEEEEDEGGVNEEDKCINEEDLYNPDSPTPTPTPNGSNTNNEERFNEFNDYSSVQNTGILPPPSTLALRTNLNNQKQRSQISSPIINKQQQSVPLPPPLPPPTVQYAPIYGAYYPHHHHHHPPPHPPHSNTQSPIYHHPPPPPPHHLNPYITTYTSHTSNQSIAPHYNSLNLTNQPPPPPPTTATTTNNTNNYLTVSNVGAQVPALSSPTSSSSSSSSTTSNQPTQTVTASSIFYVHVDAGNIFQVQHGNKTRDISGPATVKIVNTEPVQFAPPAPGQFVQQIVDENGVLIHLIISSQQLLPPPLATPHGPTPPPITPTAGAQLQVPSINSITTPTDSQTYPQSNDLSNQQIHSYCPSINQQYLKPTDTTTNTTCQPVIEEIDTNNPTNSENTNCIVVDNINTSVSPSSSSSCSSSSSASSSSSSSSSSASSTKSENPCQQASKTQKSTNQPIVVKSQIIRNSYSIHSGLNQRQLNDTVNNTNITNNNRYLRPNQKYQNNNINNNNNNNNNLILKSSSSTGPLNHNNNNNLSTSASFDNSNRKFYSNQYQKSNTFINTTYYYNKNSTDYIDSNNRQQQQPQYLNRNNNNNTNNNTSRINFPNNKKQTQQFNPNIPPGVQQAPFYQPNTQYLLNNKQMEPYHHNQMYQKIDRNQNEIDHDKEPNKLESDDIDKTDGVDQDEKENEINRQYIETFKMVLSCLKKPCVCDIESKSVLVRLTPLDLAEINANKSVDLAEMDMEFLTAKFELVHYTLELSSSDTASATAACLQSGMILAPKIIFNQVYSGDANEITLKDLMPNTTYMLRVYASLLKPKCHGNYTGIVSFMTNPSEPEQPLPPKISGVKKKNEITVRWNSPTDNGSKIINFILEFKQVDSVESDDKEIKSADDEPFKLAFRGNAKQHTVKKLTPSTCYAFRVAAENSIGISEFSKPAYIYTCGSVPNVPEPPQLVESTISSLTLSWNPCPSKQNDINYELQMFNTADSQSVSHGFMTVYNDSQLTHKILNLNKCTLYQFRLRATNSEGSSGWSEVRKYATSADVPKCPMRLKCARMGANKYKINWEAPKDDGGSKIDKYYLEMSDSNENSLNFELIYTLLVTDIQQLTFEYHLDKPLRPGRSYLLRFNCSNSIGMSSYSELCQFTSAPQVPQKSSPPRLHLKPKSNCIQLKWTYPENDNDGGSPITSYEVKQVDGISDDDESDKMIIYRGPELTCIVNGLQPDRTYGFRLRAINKVGTGAWSDIFECNTGAGSPDPPHSLSVQAKSSSFLLITWSEPASNGSPITEYRVEWACLKPDANNLIELNFTQIYTGNQLKYELKGSQILPATRYLFRVQAININGSSVFSQHVECLTPASVPSMVNGLKLEEINSESIVVSWKAPISNGSPIISYNIDLTDLQNSQGSSLIVVNQNQLVVHNNQASNTYIYKIGNLQADTSYRLRIQASNTMGVGQFSNNIKVKTKALAPSPPQIELVSTSYNSMKLKWSYDTLSSQFTANQAAESASLTRNALNDYQIVYNLEMMPQVEKKQSSDKKIPTDKENYDDAEKLAVPEDEEEDEEFILVYTGPLNTFKVTKLNESTTYLFRISASNETGQGKWSDIYKFSTTKSPPIIQKGPSLSEITHNSCLIEWQQAKQTSDKSSNQESIEYCLQLQQANLNRKELDYREIYRGELCSYRLKELESNTDYNVRVCAIRRLSNGNCIFSPFSPSTSFTTCKLNIKTNSSSSSVAASNNSISNKNNSNSSSNKNLSNSDQIKSNKFGWLYNLFIWPAFNSKFGSATTTKASSSILAQKSQLSKITSNNQLRKHQLRSNGGKEASQNGQPGVGLSAVSAQASTHIQSAMSSSSSAQIDSQKQSKSSSNQRQISDQQWACFLILILVFIAFLIAFAVNSIYTSSLSDLSSSSSSASNFQDVQINNDL